MLRSTLTTLSLAIAALFATGCAGKVRSDAGLSLNARGYAGSPSITARTYGNASASGYGGVHGYGNAYGQGSAHPRGYVAAAPVPVPAPFTPPPVFFGVPLTGAQDLVFVLDRSGSMSASTSASGSPPSSPLAALATLGLHATSTLTTTNALAPQGGLWLWNAQAVPSTPSKMDAAKSELIGALAALPDNTRFNIVFFNDGVTTLSPQMVTLNAVTRLSAFAFVHGVNAAGNTAAVPALRTAYTSRPYRVVFLSDGLANRGGGSHELLAEARIEMMRGVRFDTVGVGPDQDGPLMASLAQESGGLAVRR